MTPDTVDTARSRIGQRATLDYPPSPWHGHDAPIVDVTAMSDGQIVFTPVWDDGQRASYVRARLRFPDDPA